MASRVGSKWGKAYWADLGERAGSTLVQTVLGVVTATTTNVIPSEPNVWWALVGLPTAVSILKGLLVNLGGGQPTASVVDVTSNGV